MFDCIVIGGGVVGCAVLDKLASKGFKAMLAEKEDDVACGASRANSGIVHAGYDCVPDTLKARFNVAGNAMFPHLCEQLDVPFKKTGSLVLGRSGDRKGIEELCARGLQNGVDVRILDRAEALAVEPNLSDDAGVALYAPEAGIVSPYKLTIALADRAVLNGAKVELECEITSISKDGDGFFTLNAADGRCYRAKYIINSAGENCDKINGLAGAERFDVSYARGDYFVLDSLESENIRTVLFPLPDERGKGVLVAPTADGNVIYGPTSVPTVIDDTAVTKDGLDFIRLSVPRVYKRPNYRKVIRLYAGLRTVIGTDFIIQKSQKVAHFFILAGICSPGLTSAPAIAEYVADEIGKDISPSGVKGAVTCLRRTRLHNLTSDKLNALVAENPAWGRMVCRCEKVTEAEIVDAIHSPVPALTVDAVKRRTRSGMGRCQGGFCAPRVMDILARELNLPITAVKKGGAGSEIAVCAIKEADDE